MKKRIFSLIFAFFVATFSFAEVVRSDLFDYSIDLPEMFYISDMTEDQRSILFLHKLLPVQVVVKVAPKNNSDVKKVLSENLVKLSAQNDIATFKWRNQNSAISKFVIPSKIMGQEMKGWGSAVELPDNKNVLVVLSFLPSKKFDDCAQFIMSVLDSVMIDQGSLRQEGLVTTFAFSNDKKEKITLNIEKKVINSTIFVDDAEAAQFVIDREFEVFKLYVNQKCWKEAWQRFYRIVAKDAFGRIKKLAWDINLAFQNDEKFVKSKNQDLILAQSLLSWTQNFDYQRRTTTSEKADLVNVISTAKNLGSDCDSRSLLLMILYKALGIDSILLISKDYSHAMVGVNLENCKGQSFLLDGKEYLFGETTAKGITFGKIQAKMQDRSKWIPVELYD